MDVVVPGHGVTDDAVDRSPAQAQRAGQRPAQARDVGEVTDATDQHARHCGRDSLDEAGTRGTDVTQRSETDGVVRTDHHDGDIGAGREQRVELIAEEIGHPCAANRERTQLEAPLMRLGYRSQGLAQPHVARVVETGPGERAVAGSSDANDAMRWIPFEARRVGADDGRQVAAARPV